MRPTVEEIRRAAYHRWERRGWNHGGDRDDWFAAEADLTYRLNYRTIAEYALDAPGPRILGDGSLRRCRFCERTAAPARFGRPRPVIAGAADLLTAEVCADCQEDWREALDQGLADFRARLKCETLWVDHGRPPFTVAAFKSLTASALLLMPGCELRYFHDALEWVSNPDHDSDDQLLDNAECRLYRADFLGECPQASLARRVDDEAPLPYMLFFLESDGIVVQVPLPMCIRDEDLDGRSIERPERILTTGRGHEFREAHTIVLPLSRSDRRARRSPFLQALAS
jgi:hypothetical protein